MKRIILPLLALLFASQIFSQQHQLPNSDFENIITIDTTWSDGPALSYDSITGGIWGNGNVLLPDFPSTENIEPFMKDTNFTQSGNHAVVLRTQMIGPAVATGNLFTGFLYPQQLDLNAPLFGAKTGVPFAYRPISFNGYYYYTSVNQDSCWMACLLTKWNSNTNQRDTIGYGEFFGYNSSTQYEPFSVTVNYTVPEPTLPDSVSLMLLSSGGGLNYQGQPGSTLILDSLWFDQPANAGIENNDPKSDYSWYSQGGELFVDFNGKTPSNKITIYDLSGKKIKEEMIHQSSTWSTALTPSKIYIMHIQNKNNSLKTKVFIHP